MISTSISRFEPAPWLPNGHLQSIFASLLMPVRLPAYHREVIALPDGDIIAADWINGSPDAPLLVLIHGMEGSSQSRYARLIMQECLRRGWRGVVLHMRSCGGLMNKQPQFYHAGFYADVQYFIDELLPEEGLTQKLYLVGVSLGGSQVAHYLAKGQAGQRVRAATIISTPLDLAASADHMSKGFSRVYVARFRNSLLEKYQLKEGLIQDDQLAIDLAQAKTFWDLDNAATAPMHGFRDASHYYREMSSKNCLKDIQVPALYLASRDDPFVPEDSMPHSRVGNVTSLLSQRGGHVGFVDRRGRSWMVPTIFEYLNQF